MITKQLIWIPVLLTAPVHAALVSHWSFNEGAGVVVSDSTSGFSGAISGNVSFVGGINGTALSFDGSPNTLVNMGNSFPGFTSGSFSISLWVNTTSTATIFPLSKHESGTQNGFLIGLNSGSGYGMQDKAYFYDSTPPGVGPISTTTVNDGSWHHVVGVYEAGVSARIYVDGGISEASATAFAILGNSAPLLFGGLNISGTPTALYTGLLDDVQIYNSALSDSEIGYLSSNPGLVVPEPSTWSLAVGLGALVLALRRRRG